MRELCIVLLGCGLYGALAAQPGLVNGDFDQTPRGSQPTAGPGLSALWSPADAAGAANSGSIGSGVQGTPVTLKRHSYDSGGGAAAGGAWKLQASIGQSDAGQAQAAGIRLQAGFQRARLSTGPVVDQIFSDRFQGPP